MKGRLAVVQRALAPLGPRARRAEYLSEALRLDWAVMRWPRPRASIKVSGGASRAAYVGRGALKRAGAAVFLDRLEPETRRTLKHLPQADAGLLIGPPFSPVTLAAAEFAKRGTPYVLDLGDPWALTASSSTAGSMTSRRQRRSEDAAFAAAAGAVLTTQGQADAISDLFPKLPIMVRPNGYEPVETVLGNSRRRGDETLRLVYYGGFYETYSVPALRSLCALLAAAGAWRDISLTVYGRDWTGALAAVPPPFSVIYREPVPWPTAVAGASDFDAALVVGHSDPRKLPSKAVQYLTLPIPRIAACAEAGDSLDAYVANKPGYRVVTPKAANAEELVIHLRRDWTADELAPPAGESWDEVAPVIARFVTASIAAS
jgi:hypothetical protein